RSVRRCGERVPQPRDPVRAVEDRYGHEAHEPGTVHPGAAPFGQFDGGSRTRPDTDPTNDGRRRQVTSRAIAIVPAVLIAAASVSGQGNSAGQGNAHQGGITAGAAVGATPLPGSGTGTRTFGVWLDDASVAAPGGGWATFAVGSYNTDLFHEADVPVADAG